MTKRKTNTTLLITTIMCLIPIILGVVLYSRLPDRIPIHFDHAGNPNDYMPRAAAVFGLPAFMAAINWYAYIRYNKDPKVQNASITLRKAALWIPPILSLVLIPSSLFISMGVEIPIVKMGATVVGIVIVIWGNYLPKCRQNYTLGYRLPWTLDNESNWNKTHRFAGFIWVVAGLSMIINSFFDTWYLHLAIIVLIILLPIAYSYITYQSETKEV